MKKILAMILAAVMILTAVGCGSQGGTNEESSSAAKPEEKQTEAVQEAAAQDQSTGTEEQEASELDTQTPITLRVYGPGPFGDVPEAGGLNAITGKETMGWDKIVERWNELHPNVTLDIQGIGWTDWIAAVQAAVLGEGVDVITHASPVPELCVALDSYLDADPEFREELFSVPKLHTTAIEGYGLENPAVVGIPICLNACMFVLNKKIFDDYGVPLPDASWTWSEAVDLASQLTGTDPVTGEQTYGITLPTGGNIVKPWRSISSSYDAKLITYGATIKDCKVDFMSDGIGKSLQTLTDLAQYINPDNFEGISPVRFMEGDVIAMGSTEQPVRDYQSWMQAGLGEDYVLLPQPVVETGAYAGSPSLYIGDNNFGIARTSEHKEWAWEFIKFMIEDEVAHQFAVSNGFIWNTPAAVDDLKDVVGEENATMIKDFLSVFPQDFCAATNDYYDTVNFGVMQSWASDIMWELLKGNLTVEEAQEQLQANADEYQSTQE